MDQQDLELRRATYRRFVELGRAPTISEMAAETSRSPDLVREGWHRLHHAHALVMDLATDELIMANPFAGRPTAFVVEAGGRSWYANCGWDAFGIGAALGVDSTIEAPCPDCGEAMVVEVVGAAPKGDLGVFHVLVPAARWWDDITFT